MRTNVSNNPSFQELLARVREVALEAIAHQNFPFEKLVEELQLERDSSHTPLFQVGFSTFNTADQYLEVPSLTAEPLTIPETGSTFDLNLCVHQRNQGIELELVYNAEVFESARMVEMLRQFQQLLVQIADHPETRIANFSLVTPAAQVLLPNPVQPLNTHTEEAVHTYFSRQAQRVPDNQAVRDTQVTWSYAELDARSNQLAHYLLDVGIESQDIVAIYGHRSAALVWALLGILKAGAAFIILDPSYPASRLINCLRVAKPKGWLQLEAAGKLPTALEAFVETLSCCCSLQLPQGLVASVPDLLTSYSTQSPGVEVNPDNLAYVAFTSGSTGMPKGILGTHRPLSHFLQWHCQRFGLNESDRFSMLSGLAHDPLLRDIFTPLSLGATLCVPQQKDIETLGQLADWMRQEEISISHLTPAMGQLLSEIASISAIATHDITSLRYLFFSGELLTRNDVARIRTIAPNATYVNFYGATETPQAMGHFPIPSPDGKTCELRFLKERMPLGRGIDRVQLLVLNIAQQLAGIGEVGEIYIRTPYLAKGYMGNEELTQERFILSPFTTNPEDRLYKTGDLGRYLPDGHIELIGRLDCQVKIRGFRIELGEIEVVLTKHPAVQKTVVIVREDVSGDKRLVAYVVSTQKQPPTSKELRSFLQEQLPSYMVPSAIAFLDTLPLTPNGKIDRRALPAPDQLQAQREHTFVAPRDQLELKLTEIWEQVLGIQPIGVKDTLFELGGHSLLVARLSDRIQQAFDKNLSLATIFQAPTIEQLAGILRQETRSASCLSLTAIQPKGSKLPLFLCEGVSIYSPLIPYLGLDQPLYGLVAPITTLNSSSNSVEQWAAHYIKEMRTLQPEGPYFLAGLSFGGTLAFEMAQQLVAQGHKVAMLALFDTILPHAYQPLPVRDRLHYHWRQTLNLGPMYLVNQIKQKSQKFQTKIGRIYSKFHLEDGNSTPHTLEYFARQEIRSQAEQNYVPQVYPSRVTLFKASDRADAATADIASDLGWGNLAGGGLEIYEVPGDHLSILKEPYVRVLSEKLRATLDKAQTTTEML